MTGHDNHWSARGPLVTGFFTLALIVGGLGGWATLTTLAGAVIAPGQVEVEQNRQVIQHPDGGVVEMIAVEEGTSVKAGDLLVRLDGTLLRSEQAIVGNQLFELRARGARLIAERDDAPEVTFPADLLAIAAGRGDIDEVVQGQRKLFDARRETLEQQIEQIGKRTGQIESQIEGITAQRNALDQQLSFLNRELDNQQMLLDKGLAQAGRVMELSRERARILGEIGQLSSDRAQAEGRITELQIERLTLAAKRREDATTELRDVATKELELAERARAVGERIARLDIRAPVSGVVLGLQTTSPRSVLQPAAPVLYLVPQDRPLIIAAKIPTIHIDQVVVGQEARLHFSTFSSRTTPELAGRVTVVSADSIKDERSDATYYRVEIVLEPGQEQKLDGKILLPGMPVEAFLRTEDRTPLAYLVRPFQDFLDRAFRES